MRRWRVPAAGLVVALVMAALYFGTFHGARKATIAELDESAALLRSQQETLRRDIKGLEEVQAREPQLTTALRALEGFIPSGLTQPALLLQLQTAADGAGVKLTSLTFGEPELPKGAPPSPLTGTVLVAMPLTVVVEGTFVNITELMRRVEVSLDRAVLVGELALTEAEARHPQLTGTWSGQAYALLRSDDPLVVPLTPSTTVPPAVKP